MINRGYITFIAAGMFMVSCTSGLFEEEPGSDPVAMFEHFWETFNTDYGPFVQRNVDWQQVYDQYRPLIEVSSTEDQLYGIFKQMLLPLDDTHVKLLRPGEQLYTPNRYYRLRIEDALFDTSLIRDQYLESQYMESDDGGNLYGWIGSIAYLQIRWIGTNMLEFKEILREFRDADGLIIDMRHNSGGDFTFFYSEMGNLTNKERFVYRSRTKNGTGPDDFTRWYEWYIYPAGDYFDKPVVVLTDRYTVSAAERSVMALKTLPNVVHMGDTTNGSMSTMIGKELPNGWYYSVAPQVVEFRDGICYEGTGLIPDVVVENTMEEMAAGRDGNLEAALEVLSGMHIE